jgi:hypothetical protein
MRLAILIVLTAVIGCDKGDDPSENITGSWVVTKTSSQRDGLFISFLPLVEFLVQSGFSETQANKVIADHSDQVLITNTFTHLEFKSDGTWVGTTTKEIRGKWRVGKNSRELIVTADGISVTEQKAGISYITDKELHIVDGFDVKHGSETVSFLIELTLLR